MRSPVALAGLLAVLACTASATTYFKETFDSATWESRWKKSSWKEAEGAAGEFKLSAGKWFGDEEMDKGIQTAQDSKFSAIYSELPQTLDTTGKDLVVQFSVKHEQDLDCGGGYVKLIPESSASQMETFGGETPYSIMFGPDICGFSTRKVHVIFTKDGTNHLIKKDIKAESDQLTHVYTLIVKPDNTYKVLIDLKEVASGTLEEDWDMVPPKKIKDPSAKKPEDWDEEEEIEDPNDKKPENWDKIEPTIPDPNAKKPEDWNDEEDGAWEPPMVPNPEFQGAWKAKKIKNPNYKGKWEAPEIDNPDYKPNAELYAFNDLKFVGFELWQVKSGSIFDNIIVTDDFKEAEELANETWGKTKVQEKAVFTKVKEEERQAAEESAKAAGTDGEGDEMGDDYDEGGYGEDMDEDMDEGEGEGEEAGRDEL
mmetsp:Transcript_14862/g.40054  ORF Transcript_14862/g.40054 Transcript_14862/m.40054 type:complete len:425 (-) Transcript_14862:498-1772(-)|eukprot:CAMPEP_0202347080 /NCGR_PEP_ID=MMETSP1126-20121109/5597_1 /ASSEMBLY_ACC=CAM_ASM_000457 /TAXON_ID=3047 /ORGANISM="Dunaliella tertiolecta, Strain CCMP1320" /LENGTH=424 /DNA_ID=CAMNT_0048938583 /DNA_START=64 /DNA_END=1338 /DNA_ORIENTATION=+